MMKLTLKNTRKLFEKKRKKMSEDDFDKFTDHFWSNFNNQIYMRNI